VKRKTKKKKSNQENKRRKEGIKKNIFHQKEHE